MTTLADIEQEISNILATAEELSEDQQEVALEYLDELGVQEVEKADSIAYAIRKRQSEIQFLKDEEARLRSRRQAAEKRLTEFKEYLAQLFQAEEISKISGIKSTLYLRKSSSVEVEDVALLPSELVKTEVTFTPKKTDIKKQIENGVEVPGARINERQILMVR